MNLMESHERPTITESNLAPVVQIITWLLLGFMIMSAAARFLTKFIIARNLLGLDDVFALIALLLAVGQNICLLASTDFGLGKAMDTLSKQKVFSALKAQFAGDILGILSLWAAKLSVLYFLGTITATRSYRRALQASSLVITAWMISSIIAYGFQCGLTDTWNYVDGECFDRLSFMRYVCISNLLTELLLIGLPAAIILPLQTTIGRKVTVMASFAARSLVIGAIVGQIVELSFWFKQSDVTLYIWRYQVCTQCVLALSIMTACVPHLKPFLESLQVGALRTDNATIRHYGSSKTATPASRSKSSGNGHIRLTRDIEITVNVSESDSRSRMLDGFVPQSSA